MKKTLITVVVILSAMVLIGNLNSTPKHDDQNTNNSSNNNNEAVLTFMTSIDALKKNDVKALIKNSLSNDDFEELALEYEANVKNNASDNTQFVQFLNALTADRAEQSIYSMIEPQLINARQLFPILLLMSDAQIKEQIEQNKSIPGDQKQAAVNVASAMIHWIKNEDILSKTLTRKAIKSAIKTAKKLEIKSLADLENLNFNQAMDKSSLILGGIKDVLKVYGMSIDDTLNSIQITNTKTNENHSEFTISYEIFDQRITQIITMIRKQNHWVIN